MTYTDKECANCGHTYTPTGPCSTYCSRTCKNKYRWKLERLKRFEAGNPVGVRGGNYGRTDWNSHLRTTGIAVFEKKLRRLAKDRRFCERCSKDLLDAQPHEWCSHHRDHDRTNNVPENIELLCKRCHQLEHRCWEAFAA